MLADGTAILSLFGCATQVRGNGVVSVIRCNNTGRKTSQQSQSGVPTLQILEMRVQVIGNTLSAWTSALLQSIALLLLTKFGLQYAPCDTTSAMQRNKDDPAEAFYLQHVL